MRCFSYQAPFHWAFLHILWMLNLLRYRNVKMSVRKSSFQYQHPSPYHSYTENIKITQKKSVCFELSSSPDRTHALPRCITRCPFLSVAKCSPPHTCTPPIPFFSNSFYSCDSLQGRKPPWTQAKMVFLSSTNVQEIFSAFPYSEPH